MFTVTPYAKRGSALTTVAILMVVVGVIIAAVPKILTALAIEDVRNEREQGCYLSALSALELGRSLMYYDNMTDWDGFSTTDPVLPVTTINGYTVEFTVADEGTRDQLRIHARAYLVDGNGEFIPQVHLSQGVTVKKLTAFNFASSKFGNDGSSGLASRTWYGDVYMALLDESGYLWRFYYTQYFMGTLISQEFTSRQDNHVFMGEDTGRSGSNVYNLTAHDNAARANGIWDEHMSNDTLPSLPESIDIADALAPGGNIYEGATTDGAVITGDTELFLAPNGEVWARPFGGDASNWTVLFTEQEGKTLVVVGDVIVRGYAAGRMTIGATYSNSSHTEGGNVVLNGNIYNDNPEANHLAIAAPEGIFFENREPYYYYGNRIRDVRRRDNDNWVHGGDSAGPRLDYVSSPTTSNVDGFNFLANPVLSAADWALINNGSFPGTIGPAGSTLSYSDIAGQTSRLQQYDSGSRAGLMPRYNAELFVSLASGWFLSPACTHHASSSYHVDNHGGNFTVRGTYAMGIGIDTMATWSSSGGMMNYDLHPYQVETAPDYFLTVANAYPVILFGSTRQQDDHTVFD